MKKTIMKGCLLAQIVFCVAGCRIGSCNEALPSSEWNFVLDNPVELVLQIGILPIWMVTEVCNEVYWNVSQWCEDSFYDYPGTRESRSRCWERVYLEADRGNLEYFEPFHRSGNCFDEFDATGKRREEFYVLLLIMDDESHVKRMSRESAYAVARHAISDPNLFERVPNIWIHKDIGLPLRNQALERLRDWNSTNEGLFEKILDAPCCRDAMLERILQSSTNESEARAAYRVLCRRIQRENEGD